MAENSKIAWCDSTFNPFYDAAIHLISIALGVSVETLNQESRTA